MRFLYIIIAALLLSVGPITIENIDRSMQLRRIPYQLEITKTHLSFISKYLHEYNQVNGTYPTNDQGLHKIAKLIAARRRDYVYNREIPRLLRVTPSGILAIWGDPYIYENRNGMAASKFKDSGATIDTARRYSIKVDDGIYVWSIAARKDFLTYEKWKFLYSLNKVINGLALLFVLLFVISCFKAKYNPKNPLMRRLFEHADSTMSLSLLNIIAGFGLGFVVWTLGMTGFRTCYDGGIYARMRRPETTKQYLAVIRKYHQRGVISNSAYNKLIQGLKEDINSYEYRRMY